MQECLKDTRYLEVLNDIFKSYHEDLEGILDLATVVNNGICPAAIENELYSAFHHISRSLFEERSIEDSISEINRAKHSYLNRDILDSYKIAINGILKQLSPMVEQLQELILDDDFRDCITDCTDQFNNIIKLSKMVKETYLSAKKSERSGHFSESIQAYNEAIDLCADLDGFIQNFENDRIYLLAVKRIQKKKKEVYRQKKIYNRHNYNFVFFNSFVFFFLCRLQ